MNLQDRIDALTKALAKLDLAIQQTDNLTPKGDDILTVASQLADLKAGRESLNFQLDNLKMATGEVPDLAPAVAARLTALSGDLDNIILRQATVSGVLDFGTAILGKVSDLRKAATTRGAGA